MPTQSQSSRFHLVRYFSIASIVMFILVAIALSYFIFQQSSFFKTVQQQQLSFFAEVQDSFAKRQQEVARRDLIDIHESGNINLTRLFANALWDVEIAPFAQIVSAIPVDHCRAMADIEKDGKKKASKQKKACFQEVGREIMATPGFEVLDAKIFDSMKKSTVFKVKVFDTRGITIYSSQHSQIGDDKAFNKGWQSATKGIPASELTHRDTFSAFEGVVEDRDVIGSYQPVYQPGTDTIVGVLEVYSDVTQFLQRIGDTEKEIRGVANQNQSRIETEAEKNLQEVDQASTVMLIIILALLLILFIGLFLIVRRADNIIVEQEHEREESRTQIAQAEKMASLGQMVAGVAHQLNTPLAFSQSNLTMIRDALVDYEPAGNVLHRLAEFLRETGSSRVTINLEKSREKLLEIDENLPEIEMFEEMLGDTLTGIEQMQEMVENLRDFTRLDRAKTAMFDLNKSLKNVVYIAKSVIPTTVEVKEEYLPIPEIMCNPSQLNQIFLNLINNAAHAIEGSGTVTVHSHQEGGNIIISFSDDGRGIPDDVLPHIFDMYYTTKPEGEGTGMGLAIARTIANEHGGDIDVTSQVGEGTTFNVTLPIKSSITAS